MSSIFSSLSVCVRLSLFLHPIFGSFIYFLYRNKMVRKFLCSKKKKNFLHTTEKSFYILQSSCYFIFACCFIVPNLSKLRTLFILKQNIGMPIFVWLDLDLLQFLFCTDLKFSHIKFRIQNHVYILSDIP